MVQLAIAGYNRQNNVDWEQCPLLAAACQRYIPAQPELALSDPRAQSILRLLPTLTLRGRQFIANVIMSQAAVSDLRAALELEPNTSNIQAALGYALWDSGDIAQSREMLNRRIKGFRTIRH